MVPAILNNTYCDSPSWVIPFGIDPTQTYHSISPAQLKYLLTISIFKSNAIEPQTFDGAVK
jgi:hypothetical protein